MTEKFDLIVIGAGPAGEEGAANKYAAYDGLANRAKWLEANKK